MEQNSYNYDQAVKEYKADLKAQAQYYLRQFNKKHTSKRDKYAIDDNGNLIKRRKPHQDGCVIF